MKELFSRRVLGIEEPPTMVFRELAARLAGEGHQVVSMVGGEPDFNTPRPIIEAAYKAMIDGHTRYINPPGLPELRARIARKLREENGIQATPDEVIVTASGKYAIYIALCAILNEGDEVMLLEPAWVSYKPQIELCGGRPVSVPLDFSDNYAITKEKLEAHVGERTKAIVLNFPNNPTGRVLTREEADVVADFTLKHDILIISDEIYEKIIYDGRKHISPGANEAIKDRVITINGFSKAFAMCGWRLGYVAANREIAKQIIKVQSQVITCPASFSQYAAVVAFDCVDEVAAMAKSYWERRDAIVEGLGKVNGVTCRKPEGAFYVIPQIEHEDMKAWDLSMFLLKEARVGTTPGDSFGYGMERCVRMSFACSMDEINAAVANIAAVLGRKQS